MADEVLKIRVDVQTATLKELGAELRRVIADISDGSKSIDAQDEIIKRLIATTQSETSSIKDVSNATQLLNQIRQNSISLGEIETNQTKELDDAIVAGKNRVEAANKMVFSSNAQLKDSYFVLGEQLRRIALQQGGYVSQKQIENLAERESARSKITLAQATELVTKQLQAEGIQIVSSINAMQADKIATEVAAREKVSYASALQAVKTQLAASNIQVVEQTGVIRGLGNAFTQLQGKIIAAYAAYQSVKFLVDAAEEAARVKLLRQEIERLSQSANERGAQSFNATKLIEDMDSAAGKTVKQIDLLQIALRAIQLGNIDLNKLPAVMERVDYLSKLIGEDSRTLFDNFIRGAETGSKKFQVQFGLLYDVKKAQDDYAKSIGVTTDKLTDEEKRLANVNIAIDALLKRQIDNNSEAVKTVENFERMNVAFDEAKLALGELISTPVGKFLTSLALGTAITAEVMQSLGLAIYAVGQAGSRDFEGFLKTMKEIQDIGVKVVGQEKEIVGLFSSGTSNEPKKKNEGFVGPVKPANFDEDSRMNAKELADYLKETEKLLADEQVRITADGIQRKLAEEKRFHDERIKQFEDARKILPQKEAELQQAIAAENRRHAQAGVDIGKEFAMKELQNRAEAFGKLSAVAMNYTDKELADTKENYAKRLIALKEALDADLLTIDDYNKQKLQAEQTYQDELKRITIEAISGKPRTVKESDMPMSHAERLRVELDSVQQIMEEMRSSLGGAIGLDALEAGFDRVGQAIQRGLIDKLPQANSLFQNFVFGILQGLAQIAIKLASMAIISGILSLFGLPFGATFKAMSGIGGGESRAFGGEVTEPVVGIGQRTGKIWKIGESGNEMVVPMAQYRQMVSGSFVNSSGQLVSDIASRFGSLSGFNGSDVVIQEVSSETRTDGRDLYTIHKFQAIMERKRGGR